MKIVQVKLPETFSIDIPETKMKDFSSLEGFVPGKFTVSSGALTGAVTAASLHMTANTINGVCCKSN